MVATKRTALEIETIKRVLHQAFEHNMSIISPNNNNWKLEFYHPTEYPTMSCKKALGYCDYKNSTVVISTLILEHGNLERICDILLHEMAHIMAPGHKHNKTWRRCARLLGANDRSTSKSESAMEELGISVQKWVIVHKKNNELIVRGSVGRRLKHMSLRYYPDNKEQTKGNLYLIEKKHYMSCDNDKERMKYLVQ